MLRVLACPMRSMEENVWVVRGSVEVAYRGFPQLVDTWGDKIRITLL